MSKKFLFILIFLLIGVGVLYLYNKYRVPPSINLTKLSLIDLSGEPINFEQFKGKKTMVCFSASWCPNCIREMNALKKIKDTDLFDVEIVIIDDEPIEKLIKFKKSRSYPFTFLKLNKPFSSVGINSIPVTYFYDAQLQLKKDAVGEIEWSDASTREHYKHVMN